MPHIDRDAVAVHALVLEPGVAMTVTTTSRWPSVQVLVHDSDAPVFYTVDGTEPEVDGARCFVIPANVVAADVRPLPGAMSRLDRSGRTLKFVSAARAVLSVQRGE